MEQNKIKHKIRSKQMSEREYYAIHTSDLNSYRKCRRKWSIESQFRNNLRLKKDFNVVSSALFLGSGVHFALEDSFGHKRFNNGSEAFKAYMQSQEEHELPEDYKELTDLGCDMINYYEYWERNFTKWETLVIDGVPQVEVDFGLILDNLEFRGLPVVFAGTIDRIVKDEYGDYWLLDYKTASSFNTSKLDLDTQITAYLYAAEQFLGINIKGMIYVQIHKNPPKAPKVTKTGVSTDKRQRTTYQLYLDSCIQVYGEDNIPEANLNFLNDLKILAGSSENLFVRYDKVERNEWAKKNFYNHLLCMAKEMVNEDTYIYPNPSPDCSWYCPYKSLCIAKEENADFEYYLEQMEKRPDRFNTEPEWMIRLKNKYPEKF